MTYTIVLLNERADYILANMKDATKLIRNDGEYAVLEITISRDIDILHLIHRGIEIGTQPFINHL